MKICKMNVNKARQIAGWTYPEPYEIYGFRNDEAEVREIMNGLHFAVTEKRELIGFVAIGWSAQVRAEKTNAIYDDESYTDIALGLRPDLCGQGLGRELVATAVSFVKELFPDDDVRLTVRNDNKRAIKCYESCGFRKNASFDINGAMFYTYLL